MPIKRSIGASFPDVALLTHNILLSVMMPLDMLLGYINILILPCQFLQKKKHFSVKVSRLGVFRQGENSCEGRPIFIYANAKGSQKSFLKKAEGCLDS
jgi:hypothetical protein